MKSRLSGISPILFIIPLLAVLLFMFSFIEYRSSKADIEHLMDSEAQLFLQTVFESSQNTIFANDALEEEMSLRLFNNNYLIDILDRNDMLDETTLAEIAVNNAIFRINIFDTTGRKILSSHRRGAGYGRGEGGSLSQLRQASSAPEDIKDVINGTVSKKNIGFKKGRFSAEDRYAAAIKRSKGGAIVSVLDVNNIVEMRKNFGFGRLIQGISLAPEVIYAAFQDEDGVITASPGVTELSALESDPFLLSSLESSSYKSRITKWNGMDIFEAVSPFVAEGYPPGMFRIGFSLEELHLLKERLARRLAILSLFLLIFSIVVINFTIVKNQRRLLANKLESLESFTKTVLDNTREAIVVLSADRRIQFFNKSAVGLFGVPLEKALEEPYAKVLPDYKELIDHLVETQTSIDGEEIVSSVNNERRYLTCNSSFITKEGTLKSVITIWNDVTDKRRMERQIQRKERMTAMGELASGVAHEIRNPLNAIQVIVQRLGKEFQPAENAADEYVNLVNTVRGEIRRVNKIIERFLHFARPPDPEKKPVSVRAFITDVTNIFESQIAEKGMKLVNKGFDDAVLSIDPEQMKQVLLNLTQNSIDFMDKQGVITIAGKSVSSGYKITFSDTGTGIEPENMKKIFNLYFSTKPTGTGLGLSLVHQITTQHDGIIDVESTPNKGTTFTIILPEGSQQ